MFDMNGTESMRAAPAWGRGHSAFEVSDGAAPVKVRTTSTQKNKLIRLGGVALDA